MIHLEGGTLRLGDSEGKAGLAGSGSVTTRLISGWKCRRARLREDVDDGVLRCLDDVPPQRGDMGIGSFLSTVGA
jgi:hypothetical protein